MSLPPWRTLPTHVTTLESGHWGIHAARLGTGQGLSATKQGITGTQEDTSGRVSGAEGGIRTHTPLRAADFESAASTIPPLRRCVPCKKEEWSGRGDSNPRPSPWQGDALPLSHFRSDGGISLHPYSTKKQAAVNPSASLAPPPHPTSSSPYHPRRHPRTHPPPPLNPPPQSRRASDPTPLQPCHPPLALAPRRLYTSPMRNPTSACPRLPHPARGTSPRSTNCPESGPPYPQNGSCRTRRIVSAADGFEADSFPKIENTWRWNESQEFPSSSGSAPASTPATAARTCAAPTRRRPGTPTPHKADAARGSPAKE